MSLQNGNLLADAKNVEILKALERDPRIPSPSSRVR